MKPINKIAMIMAVLFILAISLPVHSQTISADQLKQNIQKRLDERTKLITDYQCEMTSQSVFSTPRGDREMESKFKVYAKSPDKRKVEFIEGKRGGKKITTDDMNRRRGNRGGRGRRGPGGFGGESANLDISKYLNDISVVGTENIESTPAYKLKIKVSDKEDRFKSITVWVDQKTFDVIKYEAKLRPNERLDSGSVEMTFAPVGPGGAWMAVKGSSERYMVFESPRGVMEIESTMSMEFKNYKFNIGLKDDVFKTEE